MSEATIQIVPPWYYVRVQTLNFAGLVELEVETINDLARVSLTPDQIDALIRALAAARVELSKARP